MITGSSNSFAIIRPKPDETSVILEGYRAIGNENVNQLLLTPYDASDTLNQNIGNIVKAVNNYI